MLDWKPSGPVIADTGAEFPADEVSGVISLEDDFLSEFAWYCEQADSLRWWRHRGFS